MQTYYIFVALFFTLAYAEEKYTTKYDNVDLDQILKNDRLLNNYAKCLLDQGTCTPDASELKKVLPDALKSECTKCNDKQKEGSKKVLNFLVENKPEIYAELEKKYDPSGEYKKKYCKLGMGRFIAAGSSRPVHRGRFFASRFFAGTVHRRASSSRPFLRGPFHRKASLSSAVSPLQY